MYFKSFCYTRNRTDSESPKRPVPPLLHGLLEALPHRPTPARTPGRWGREIFVLKNLLSSSLHSVYFPMYSLVRIRQG